MRLLPLFHLFCLAAVAPAQQPAAPGQTGKAPTTPGAKSATTETALALARDWEAHLAPASGAQAVRLADLRTLLEGFGKARADTAEHPILAIYEGQQMDGTPDDQCRITYLMPLPQAEGLLFKKRVLGSVTRVLAPGLPEGLFLHSYDVHAGIYNRLILITDGAQPQPQVVSLVLKADGVNYYPPTPFKKIERDWHTADYVSTQIPGQGQIDTRVNDELDGNRRIVVNTTGRTLPMLAELPPPGIASKPAKASPKETMTWYVPEPLIQLMLYCIGKQLKQ